jgi:predicted phage-related endonuclease
VNEISSTHISPSGQASILDIEEHTPEWHAIRLQNIGGSEIGGLFGVQEVYGSSEYSLHLVKSKRIPAPPVDDSPGSRIWVGTRKEPIIAAIGAELYGWRIAKGGYCLDGTTPGMACSLDYLITEPGPDEIERGFTGPGVLQIKNVDGRIFREKWTGDEPPFPILLQLQHEIACSGCTWGVILAEVGGNEYPAFRYAARDKTITMIRKRVAEFWQRVRDGKLPLADGSQSTADALAALYPTLAGDLPVDLSNDNELPEICAGIVVAKADVKGAEANLQGYENRLKEKMGGNRKAICNGFRIDGVFTPENLGTPAGDLDPDKIIGARKASKYFKVKEIAA